jgi:hypothetical protein
MAVAYAGICVGASAATKKARWALMIAIACMILPKMVTVLGSLAWRGLHIALDAPRAVEDLIDALFRGGRSTEGILAILVLLMWGVLGTVVVSERVRREMTP